MPLPNINYAPGQDNMSDVFDKTNSGLTVAGLQVVSNSDTTYGYLGSKIIEGSGITKTILSPSGNEVIEIKATPIEAWTSVNVSGGDITSGTIKYRKDNDGHVFLMGNFTFDSSVGADNASLFTLPSGYRPAQIVSFGCTNRSVGGAKNILAISVNTSGDVSWITQTGSAFNNNTIYIDGINFFID